MNKHELTGAKQILSNLNWERFKDKRFEFVRCVGAYPTLIDVIDFARVTAALHEKYNGMIGYIHGYFLHITETLQNLIEYKITTSEPTSRNLCTDLFLKIVEDVNIYKTVFDQYLIDNPKEALRPEMPGLEPNNDNSLISQMIKGIVNIQDTIEELEEKVDFINDSVNDLLDKDLLE